jgi:hypothetical protein
MSTTLKPIPVFASEADERQFWETHDSTDYVDWSSARRVRLPYLKPSRALQVGGRNLAGGKLDRV